MPTREPSALTRFLTGRRTAWLVALVPLLFALAVIGGVPEADRPGSPTDNMPAGADSTMAVELAQELPEEQGSVALVLWTADEGELTDAQLDDLSGQAIALLEESDQTDSAPGSGQGGGPDEDTGEANGPLQVAEDGTAALGVVPVDSSSATDNIDVIEDLRGQLREDTPDGVTVQVTGPAGIQADIGQVFDGANSRLLIATAGVVALLLILTYRSPTLWLIPLTVVAVADRFAAVTATRVLDVTGQAWDESTIGILSVLVFGAGTDYALLLISRYREELKQTESRHLAMARALGRTAEAVVASSLTVFLGLMTLLLSAVPATRGLGLACGVGIVIAATFALVVLPAALVVFGRWIFWPRVPHVGDPTIMDAKRSLWRWVGSKVAHRPRAFVAGTLAFLAVLMLGTLQIDTGLKPSDQFLETPEAIVAADRLGDSFPAGTTDPVQVLTRDDPDDVLKTVSGVEGISSAQISAEGDGVAQIDAVLVSAPGSAEAGATVLEVRDSVADLDATHVGGGDAEAIDDQSYAARDRLVIFPLILMMVLLALVVVLRSVMAPLLLVATVLATYVAAMGASWWLFTGLFGFEAMDVGVPLLAFLFLVALGVDYNIFLVTRAREEGVQHGTKVGMLRGLTATGGVITSAGIVLAAVFAVLGVLPLVVLAQLGAIIFVGVLLDTFVVRTVLVPALALSLGDRFWWPRKVPAAPSGE